MARTYKRDAAGRFSGSGGGIKGAIGRRKKNRGIRKDARKRSVAKGRADRAKVRARKTAGRNKARVQTAQGRLDRANRIARGDTGPKRFKKAQQKRVAAYKKKRAAKKS